MKALIAAVTLAVALAGCASAPEAPAGATAFSAPAAPVLAPVPVSIQIPTVGISSTAPLVPLGLDSDQRLQTPDVHAPEIGGWYAGGVHPGDVGPAVIAAHVSGRPVGATHSVPGLFARLHEVQPSVLVHVGRADGSTVTFQVTRVERYDKDSFPSKLVYGNTEGPELRLITCGGAWDAAAHSFESNVVAFAKLV